MRMDDISVGQGMTFHAFTHVEDPLLLDLVVVYLDFCFSSSAFSLALCSLIPLSRLSDWAFRSVAKACTTGVPTGRARSCETTCVMGSKVPLNCVAALQAAALELLICKTYICISLFGLVGLFGEENEFRLVLFQTQHVGLKRFCRSILASVIDSDANGKCFLFTDSSFFEFCKRESTPGSEFSVVLDRGTTDGRTQRIQRTRCQLGSLCQSSHTTRLFGAGLIEPSANVQLPILAEMLIG